MSKKVIGTNPLDLLLAAQEKPAVKQGTSAKERLTIVLSKEVLERAKNAVYWTRGMTLAKLTEQALEAAVDALEQTGVIHDEYTGQLIKKRGAPFPKRKKELSAGRPLKEVLNN